MKEMKSEDIIDTILFFILFFPSFYLYWLIPIEEIHLNSRGFQYSFFFIEWSIYLFPLFLFIIKRKIYAIVLALFFLTYGITCAFSIGLNIEMKQVFSIIGDIWQIWFSLMFFCLYFGLKILTREYLDYRKLSLEEKKKQLKIAVITKRISYFFIPIIWYKVVSWINWKLGLTLVKKWFYPPTFY